MKERREGRDTHWPWLSFEEQIRHDMECSLPSTLIKLLWDLNVAYTLLVNYRTPINAEAKNVSKPQETCLDLKKVR